MFRALSLPLTPPHPPSGGSHLQQHVSRLDASVCCHRPALHDGADVDAPVSPLVALAHDADAQEVVLLWQQETGSALHTCCCVVLHLKLGVKILIITGMDFRQTDRQADRQTETDRQRQAVKSYPC